MADAAAAGGSSHFMLLVSGEIESGQFPEFNDLYCKYNLVYGQDWSVAAGVEEGISQMTRRNGGPTPTFVWNFPLNITFRSTNPFGWPQLVVCVYGVDALGRDSVRGYGCVHLPMTPGRHRETLEMFAPEPSTKLREFIGWLTGQRPEFVYPSFVAESEGREVTRVRSQGTVDVVFNVALKDLHRFGYRNGAESNAVTA